MKNYIIIGIIMFAIGSIVTFIFATGEVARGRVTESYSDHIDNYVVLDSLHYGSFDVTLTANKRDVKKSVEKFIAKGIGLERNSVESKMNLSVSTEDTVKMEPIRDSILNYQDKWLTAKVNLYDSTMIYRARDSLTQYIERIYKHRFLWWKWGTKGYRVHIVNHNPHSKIDYADYIRVGE